MSKQSMSIPAKVTEYTDKYLPLHQMIGEGRYGDHEIAQALDLSVGTPMIRIDDTWYVIDMQSIIMRLADMLDRRVEVTEEDLRKYAESLGELPVKNE